MKSELADHPPDGQMPDGQMPDGQMPDGQMPDGHVVEIKRMWEGGPLRNWSAAKTKQATMAYGEDGYVGSYVCDECRRPVRGVYFVQAVLKWVCGGCLAMVRCRTSKEKEGVLF